LEKKTKKNLSFTNKVPYDNVHHRLPTVRSLHKAEMFEAS